MKKKILFFILFSLLTPLYLLYLLSLPSFAARERIRVNPPTQSGGGGSAPVSYSSYGGASSSVKFRDDRKAVILTLSNMGGISSVSYQLTYIANGVSQGVMGKVDPSLESTATRELLFGTCSHGVCTYHTNISNMKLTVSSHLNSGVTVIKPYRIRP